MIIFDISLLVDELIVIKSNRATANRYRQLGYVVPDQLAEDNTFNINPADLPNTSKQRVKVKCLDCSEERVITFADRANRCSTCANTLTAKNVDMFGENNPNYKHHITDEERAFRVEDKRDYRFRRWSFAVKERDSFTCQVCLTTEARFNSHHLNGYSEYPEERYEVDNGVCLCTSCHKKLHNVFGLKTTVQDYLKFKEENYHVS